MSEVEHVATWVSLFLAVTGIVLSIVAIAFTWAVNRRAEELNDETIRALASIERDVKQVADDTRGLIREAWTKMLGGHEIQTIAEEAAAEVAEAHAEAQAAVTDVAPPGTMTDTLEQVRAERDSLREAVERANRALVRLQESSYADAVELLKRISPEARELVRIIYRSGSLTDSQAAQLDGTSIEPLLDELKTVGLIRRMLRFTQAGQGIVRGWNIPSKIRSQMRLALRLFEHNEPIEMKLLQQLRAANYPTPAAVAPADESLPDRSGDMAPAESDKS